MGTVVKSNLDGKNHTVNQVNHLVRVLTAGVAGVHMVGTVGVRGGIGVDKLAVHIVVNNTWLR